MNPPKESDHQIGSGDDRFGVELPQPTQPTNATSHPAASQSLAACDENHSLDPQVMAGHEMLNPGIVIPPGEWLEIARIQKQHGAAAMLIWQARAVRRTQAASGRVVPAYYAACAAREAADAYQPPRRTPPEPPPADLPDAETADPDPIPTPRRSPRTSAAPAKPSIAPEADALLRQMGIRLRSELANVPLELIQQWQALVENPALVARFPKDHRGWIWKQLRAQMLPPSTEELASWLRAAGVQEPTDWAAIAAASNGLMRLGDDLTGLHAADDPPPEPPPAEPTPPPAPTRLDAAATTRPAAVTQTADLADTIRSEVRLRSGDRTLRQILERSRIEQRGDALLVRCSSADLRFVLAHTAILRAAAIGADLAGNVQCVAF